MAVGGGVFVERRSDSLASMWMAPDIATCMYCVLKYLFSGNKVYLARHLRERKLQRALLQFFKPENWFEIREALLQAGRQELIVRPGCGQPHGDATPRTLRSIPRGRLRSGKEITPGLTIAFASTEQRNGVHYHTIRLARSLELRRFLSVGTTVGPIIVSDVTHILAAIEDGDSHAAADLLPLVYDELRGLAAARLAHEKPDQLLQATALVHEAYIRLVDTDKVQHWNSRWHFFAAASEAMRRILVEDARRRQRHKHGGGFRRVELDVDPAVEPPDDNLLAIDEGLGELARTEPQTAELVQRHYFAGLTIEQAAESLGLSPRTGYRLWAYARAWLHRFVTRDEESPSG